MRVPGWVQVPPALVRSGAFHAIVVLIAGLGALHLPLPGLLERSAATSWLGGFYLPRLAATDAAVLEGVRWPLSRALVALGLCGLATATALGATYPSAARRGAAASTLGVLAGAWIRWPMGTGLVALAVALELLLAVWRATSLAVTPSPAGDPPAPVAEPPTSTDGEASARAPANEGASSPAPPSPPRRVRRGPWPARVAVASRILAMLVIALAARRLSLAHVPYRVLDERLVAVASIRLADDELRAAVASALAAPGVLDRLGALGARSVLVHVLPANASRLADLGASLAKDVAQGPMGTPAHPRRVAVFCALGGPASDAPADALLARPGTWAHPLFAVELDGTRATLVAPTDLVASAPPF